MAIITMAKLRAFTDALEKIPSHRFDIRRWAQPERTRRQIRRFWTPRYRSPKRMSF